VLNEITVHGRRYFRFPRLADVAGLGHAFSSRDLNIRAADDRTTFCTDFGLPPARLNWQDQVHRPGIAVLSDATPPGPLAASDATIVTAAGRPVLGFSADCPLVLIFDPRSGVFGLAHASWRCLVAGLVGRLLRRMVDEFECRPADLLAGIGPSAGPERYEVQDDVYEAAADLPDREAIFRPHRDRWLLDLWAGNRGQLERGGIPPERIETAGACTMGDSKRFYSYRREGAGCGHFGLLAWRTAGTART